MVLETLMSLKDVLRNPWHMVVFGVVISAIALSISYLVFPQSAGLLTIFLISIMSAPFMLKLFRYEEWHEESELKKASLSQRINPLYTLKMHGKIIAIYSAFFVGMVIGLSVIFWILPDQVAGNVFSDQISQLQRINNAVGMATFDGTFTQIFANNLVVMVVSFIFALLFGIGAIFILAWNASVLAAAIGIILKAQGVTFSIIGFLPHGVFEIVGYLVAAIAGGVISATLVKRGTRLFAPVVTDMALMLLIAAFLVFVGAVVESSSI